MPRSITRVNAADRWIDAEWRDYLEAKALELRYERRLSTRAIAAELSRDTGKTINHGQVGRLLMRRRRQSIATAERLGLLLLADELADLEEVVAAAWEGWRLSLIDSVEVRETTDSGGSVTSRITLTRTARPDPRYLTEIRATYQRIAEVLGVVVPTAKDASSGKVTAESLVVAYQELHPSQGLGSRSDPVPSESDGVSLASAGPPALVGSASRDPGSAGES